MRPPVQASDPGDLRRRLDGLTGLPIRPSTARALLDALDRAEGIPVVLPQAAAIDPACALARLRSARPIEPAAILAESRWWTAEEGAVAETLWRHGVAARLAARRQAIEQSHADVEIRGDVALLHQLGAWALAAVEPRALAAWRGLASPEGRRAWEHRHLGGSLAALGRDLAGRWGCVPALVDAAWLHADDGLDGCASDPIALADARRAWSWAERTPWALRPRGSPPESSEPRARLLVAEVQLAAVGRFVEPDATPREEAVTRSHARLWARHARLVEAERSAASLLAEMSASKVCWRADKAEAPAGPKVAAARAWVTLVADRDRLNEQLDLAVEAHRRGVETRDLDLRRAKLDALAEFAAGAGHELNNPLAVIQGRAQLLLAKADPDAARNLRAIIAQVQRSSRFLRDLMYVARPPTTRERLCSPSQVLRACIRDLRDEAEARGVRLDLRLADLDEPILADADALRHAAEVLARNALDASPRGGVVRLVAAADPASGTLRWTISDDGEGLSNRDGAHLFDPFYSGRQAGRGLGMGLPRVSRGLALAGGELAWRSVPGRGTIFAMDLPIRPGEPPCPATCQGLPAA